MNGHTSTAPRARRARLCAGLIALALAIACAARAHAQAQTVGAESAESTGDPPEARPSTGARVELSLLSAPFGASVGLYLCVVSYCDGARSFAGSMLGGAAAGVLTATLASRRTGVSFATAQAIEGGAVWGTTTPVYLWLLASSRYDGRGLFAGMAAGEVLGAGLGALLERTWRPTSGAVALANSGSLWLSSITTLTTFAINLDLDTEGAARALGGALLAAQLVGLSAGGVVGQRFGARRGQVWLADVGGVLLGGTFPLLAWLIGGVATAPEVLLGSTAAGMAIGFVGSYLLTEYLPRRKAAAAERRVAASRRVQLALMPLRQGGGLSLSSRLR